MFYSAILKKLLESVEGTVGVGFVDPEGETVQLDGELEDYSHRLHLAYQGIFLQNLNRIHQYHEECPASIIWLYQNYAVVIKPLKDGYFLVLTLDHRKNLYQALHRLEEAAQELNQEL